MKNSIKEILKPIVPRSLLELRLRRLQKKEFARWQENGCPAPPPHHVKQLVISQYQEIYGCQILVETGTFRGDMVEAQKRRFEKIISIELGADLFEKAQRRFRNDKNVVIVHGDSGKILQGIVRDIDAPALFWLDGHNSGGITAAGDKDCPVLEELGAIFGDKKLNHIVLIDDARCFTGQWSYPTIEQLTKYVRGKNEAYEVEIKDDIIRCILPVV